MALDGVKTLTILIQPIHENGAPFSLLCVLVNFFHQDFIVLSYISLASLSPRYLCN